MSEHEHGHEHESWNENLVHGFRELKEAVEHRKSREHEHERQVRHVFDTVVVPVLEKFQVDAEADQYPCSVASPQNNPKSRIVTLQRGVVGTQPYFQITFDWTASPTGVTLRAVMSGNAHDFLKGKKINEVTRKDIADYLAERLKEVVKGETVA